MATDVGTLQSKLTLDFSQFASGMNSAISMVRSFGKQLQKALGSNATQGFSTTNQAIDTMQTNITNLRAAVANFQATMENANTTLKQFSNIQTNTSRIKQDLDRTASSMREVGRQSQKTGSQISGVSNNSKKAEQNAKKLSTHLQDSQKFAENLKRILGGIVISQAFYKMLGIMQDLVNSSVEFMKNMEQSAIAFKYLLGSVENSAGFLEALQDFAVTSPMDMKGAETSARMLMTMGFEAENTISVLRTLTDAAVVAGGEMSDTVYRIALALGQMLQSGTVKMQELRQLVNTNIPIFDILQEELGLTSKQIANIGQESVDSGKAVMAILSGLQKRFGGASLEMQSTVTGAVSAAKDSFYILFNEVMAGPYESFRRKLVQLSNTMQYLAQVARQYGAGGVFEAIIPERLHGVIRNVIGAFMQLAKAIQFLGRIASEVFSGMGEIIVNILNIVLPPITILLNAILQFTYGLLKAYPIIKYFFAALTLLAIVKPIGAMFLWFWKVIGLGKIIMAVVGYIKTLIKALSAVTVFMIHNPVVLAVTAITIAVLALTGVLQKAINKIKEFFSLIGGKITSSDKTINKDMGIGYDPNEILQPTDKETNDNAEKYKSSLTGIESKLEDIGDAADKTKNKLKNAFNQSFDEVYTINPDTSSDLGLDSLENLDLSLPLTELGEFNSALGDLTNFNLDTWTEGFMTSWQEMWEQIKRYLSEYGLGAVLAGILAGVLSGNPWIGLAAALAALFWPTIAEELGLTEEEGSSVLGAAIGVLLGAVIAKIAGAGFLTGALWSGIAALIFAGLWPAIQEYISSGDWQASVQAIDFKFFGTGVGALIGNLIGGPMGAAVGAVIGGLLGDGLEGGIDALVGDGSWKDILSGFDWDTLGAGLGTAIGYAIGGPAGAALGTVIGYTVGDGMQGGFEAWANDESSWKVFDGFDWTKIGTGLGTAMGAAIAGPFGAAVGAGLGAMIGFIPEKIGEVLGAIDGDWSLLADACKLWGKDIVDAFMEGLFGDGGLFGMTTELFDWAGECFQNVAKAWQEQDWVALGRWILEGIINGLVGVLTAITEPIKRVFMAIVDAICAIFGIHSPAKKMEPYGKNILLGILEGIVGAIISIPKYIAEVAAALFEAVGDLIMGIGSKVADWLGDGVTAITDFVSNTAESIGNWVGDRVDDFTRLKDKAVSTVSNWVSNTASTIGNWASNTATNVKNWVSDRIGDFANFASSTISNIGTWVTNAKNKIGDFVSNTASSVKSWVSDRISDIKGFVSDTGDKISTWASNTKGKISDWASNTGSKISSWASSAGSTISNWASDAGTAISNWWTNVKGKFDAFLDFSFTDWCASTFKTIANWCADVWETVTDFIGGAIDKIKEFFGLSGSDVKLSVTSSGRGGSRGGGGGGGGRRGHADGGIFDREHWAQFAEDNKAEAIIPLENDRAMQPFVDAISNGLTASLAPIIANINGTTNNNLQPLYVGTLVADERGLKELERKMQIIRIKEERRS